MHMMVSKQMIFYMAQIQRHRISNGQAKSNKYFQNNLLLISAGFEVKHTVCF